jgi:hypothetical protein
MDPTIPWFSHRYSPVTPRMFELIPHVSQRLGEMIDQLSAVMRGRRYAQPFVAPRHGRIINGPYVDAVFPQQKVGDRFAFLGIAAGTMWVSLGMTGRPAVWSTDFRPAARSWRRSRSRCKVLKCRMAAVAAPDQCRSNGPFPGSILMTSAPVSMPLTSWGRS